MYICYNISGDFPELLAQKEVLMDFRESIKQDVNINEALQAFDEKSKQLFYEKLEEYNRRFNSPEAQEYFHNLVAAIMIEYNKHFDGYNIECIYRFKSPKSLANKIVDYISRPEKHISLPDNIFDISPISDFFAMDIVLTDRPSSFHSKDPEINGLIQEKLDNQAFIAEMQEFKERLIDDEFSINPEYIYDVTKKDYYEKCLQIIDRLITMLPSEATSLVEKYTEQRDEIIETLEFIDETLPEDTLVDIEDYPSEGQNEVDFFELFDTLSSRIYDKVDLAVLTKQAKSIFSNSEKLKNFGISVKDFKEKRAPSGYVSNFIYLQTPLGEIECQLQSKNQYRDGNIGESAHTKMKDKTIKGIKIPDHKNPDEVRRFKSSVAYIAPKFFVAKMDDVERGKVLIQEYTDYKNYRKVLGQVQKGSVQEKAILSYFEKLYSLRNHIFDSSGSLQELISYDINKYLKSKSLTQIKTPSQVVAKEVETSK